MKCKRCGREMHKVGSRNNKVWGGRICAKCSKDIEHEIRSRRHGQFLSRVAIEQSQMREQVDAAARLRTTGSFLKRLARFAGAPLRAISRGRRGA